MKGLSVAIKATNQRTYTTGIPSELLGAVPREVQLSGGGVAMVTAAAALFVVALGLAIGLTIVYLDGVAESERRVREAVPATATVSSVTRRRDNDNDRYVVGYEYPAEGRSYTGVVTLRPSLGRTLSRGSTLSIEYMRSEPQRNWMAGRAPEGMPILVIPIAVLSAFAGAAGLAWAVLREWRLLSEGRVAEARIVSVTKRDRKRKTTTIAYEFTTISGAKRQASAAAGSTPPPVGSAVTILYHRERPQWTTLYPLQFVRPLRAPVHASGRRRA